MTMLETGSLPPYAVIGPVLRHDHRGDEDYYSQAGALYRLMNTEQKTSLVSSIVGAMKSVPEAIQKRQIGHFKKVDADYGERVERGLASTPAGDPRQVSVVK